ncbi:hypothetical protein BEWA_047100 [Theileria equi strain WA]|uniref:Signal peptide containing protein n=1 Tax=Theileria equi strain WA TaxID=1537102 RepID=L1L9T0_THEEQ|nr:hypothetical protein BEWA_047100 [Theileria equi strain WA]EKX72246.1 hypothetical protein BEWA_047100 [Theileria equi strain WA]|eukprot:XP_004831698.1 hypothetical protein BEWA_047100 [Theileria equi strain WA]
MNILVVFYTLFLSIVCSSTDSRDGGSNGSTGSLVSKIDGSLFNTKECSYSGVPLLACNAKPGVLAKEFKYGGETIWKNSRGSCLSALIYFKGDKPEVVTLQYRENGRDRTLFLHYNGKKWEHKKEEHERKLRELKEAPSPVAKSAGRVDATLDILKPDRGSVHVGGDDKDGVAKRVFTPKDGFALTKVLIRGAPIWKAKAGQKCTLVEAYSKGDSILVYLKVDTGTGLDLKYLERVNGKWKDVTTTDFYRKIGAMRMKKEESPEEERERHLKRAEKEREASRKALSAQLARKNVPILNLESPNESRVSVETREDKGLEKKEYYIKRGSITSIVEGEATLWKASGKEKFVFARLFSREEYSLALLCVHTGVKDEFKHFEKVGGEWISIEKEDYDKKLKDLRSGVTTKPAQDKFTGALQSLPPSDEYPEAQPDKQEIFNCRETSNYNKSAVITRYGGPNSFQELEEFDEYGDGNSESDLLWNEIVHALNGGNVEIESPIGGRRRMKRFEGDTPYTGLDEIINWSYLENVPMNKSKERGSCHVSDPSHLNTCKNVSGMEKVTTSLFFPTFQSDTVINVSKYNPTFYNLYDYHFDDIITRLIVPLNGTEITNLSYSGHFIWNSREGESLVYATIHLRETVPVLVYILKNSPSVNKTETMLRTNHGWRLIGNYPGAFKSIPRPDVVKFHCTIDLTCPDHGRIKVFDTVIGGLKTQFFVPRPGFSADKISHKGAILWRSPESENSGKESQWRAVLVRVYLRGNSCFLVKATLKSKGGSFSSVNYVHLNEKWFELDEHESEKAKWALKSYGGLQE